jgi:hypothetical protein
MKIRYIMACAAVILASYLAIHLYLKNDDRLGRIILSENNCIDIPTRR